MILSKMSYCVHSLAEMEGEDSDETRNYIGVNIITFCPFAYWIEHECLPDYSFGDEVWDDKVPMPEGYQWYIWVEETQWASMRSKDKIREDMNALGFVENLEMEKFLSGLWNCL
jgi:hypothetical protein